VVFVLLDTKYLKGDNYW